jgi:transketolase
MNTIDNLAVNTIRVLVSEAVDKANSGHPGLPMDAAPMAYTLWSKHLKHNPRDPKWPDRDRFVLSAGHGSMLIYSLLHLFGYGLTKEDLMSFRQWGSRTPGHPEYGHTVGVETTTGPLGQGIANAVGMALAEAHLAAKFNRPGYNVVDHYTYALSGDGCLQEGVASEACSLAGTLKLGKLILFYDRNQITIEGDIKVAFAEDVGKRFEAYGWQVLEVEDGNTDIAAIDKMIEIAKREKDKPSLIVVNTTIGYGCSAIAGSHKCHGSPLGAENTALLKKELKWDYTESFYVPDEVKEEIARLQKGFEAKEEGWKKLFADYAKEFPDLAAEWDKWHSGIDAEALINDEALWTFEKPLASRQSSQEVLNRLAAKLPNLIGGSADLGPSNLTVMKAREYLSPDNYGGSNIHFGIREFAMAAMANGMALHGGLYPYVATFLVFVDYLKPALRLSALMKLPVTYVMTHDSIGVGEDGPTHEPIEQMASIRCTPGTYLFRPADSKETVAAYINALTKKAPTVLALSRQTLPLYAESGKVALKGAYILKASKKSVPDVILIGTGSEVDLCCKAQAELAAKGIDARVVSMPCTQLFEEQSEAYKESVLPKSVKKRVVVEAACTFGWQKYAGDEGTIIGLDHFGASAPGGVLYKEFGITAENVVAAAEKLAK